MSSFDLHKTAKGGGNSDRSVFLEVYAGTPVTLGLKGGRAQLKDYSMPLMGGIQPGVFNSLVATTAGVAEGFTHRMSARAFALTKKGVCSMVAT